VLRLPVRVPSDFPRARGVLRELQVRVRSSCGRRGGHAAGTHPHRRLTLNLATYQATRHGTPIDFTYLGVRALCVPRPHIRAASTHARCCFGAACGAAPTTAALAPSTSISAASAPRSGPRAVAPPRGRGARRLPLERIGPPLRGSVLPPSCAALVDGAPEVVRGSPLVNARRR